MIHKRDSFRQEKERQDAIIILDRAIQGRKESHRAADHKA
jgi:hypothetical protein